MKAHALPLLLIFLPGATRAEGPEAELDGVAERAASARSEEFKKSAYDFCHDEDYTPKLWEAQAFCKVFDSTTYEVCPAAKSVCSRRQERIRLTIPPAVAWGMIGTLFVLVALGLFYFIRSTDWSRDPGLDLDSELREGAAIRNLPETPAPAIWRKAKKAFDLGQVEEAITLLHVAVLRYLDDGGLIRFHPSKTNGDYLRRIRPFEELTDLYRRISNETDRLRFGDGSVKAGVVSESLERSADLLLQPPPTPESNGVVAGSGPVLPLLLLLACGLSACGVGTRSYHSHAPQGMAALPVLLERAGLSVRLGRKNLEEITSGATVVIRSGIDGLRSAEESLPLDLLLNRDLTVVILDDHRLSNQVIPAKRVLTSTRSFGATPGPVQLAVTPERACNVDFASLGKHAGALRTPDTPALLWDGRPGRPPLSDHPMTLVPILVRHTPSGDPYDAPVQMFAAFRIDQDEGKSLPGCLLVLSSSDLFTNASLTLENNARFAALFFSSLGRDQENSEVVLVESVPRDNQPQAVSHSLGEARLLPFVAHATVWVIVLFLFLGAAFGPLWDPEVIEHKAFVEHVEAVGHHYARAGLAGRNHVAGALARFLVTRHRHQVRGGGGWAQLAKHLSEKHQLDEEHVRAALRLGIEGINELGTPSPSDPAPGSTEMLKTLSTLLDTRSHQAFDGGKKKWT